MGPGGRLAAGFKGRGSRAGPAGPLQRVHARPGGARRTSSPTRRRSGCAPARSRAAPRSSCYAAAPGGTSSASRCRSRRSWRPGSPRSTRRSRLTPAAASTTRPPRIRADNTPLGFHASVRSPNGAWYVDPYYHHDDSVYISYYGRDLTEDPRRRRSSSGTSRATPTRSSIGALDVPGRTRDVTLRTYRLALVTDPTYSTYFGGPQNVTAAKVTLMNRVDQVYEDETAIRMVLIADNDKLNLNTAADMTGANGPCGAAACFTTAQASRLRRRDADPQPDRHRPAHRREQLRHRPHRVRASTAAASPASASSAATARRRAARACRHRSATSSRSTTWRTRWVTSSPATTRSTAPSSTAPAATATPARRSSPAAARRSWPTPASASRTTSSRTATRTGRSAASTRSRRT